MRILYVEDNPANLFLVQRVARMGSHDIIHYGEGQPALDHFKDDKPDLVLMDVQLPGRLTGLDVVRALRAEGYKTPIIAVTAYAMSGDREKCLAAGCDGYLAKPLPVNELVELFKRYMPAPVPAIAEAVSPATTDAAAVEAASKPKAPSPSDETIPSRPTQEMRLAEAKAEAEGKPAPEAANPGMTAAEPAPDATPASLTAEPAAPVDAASSKADAPTPAATGEADVVRPESPAVPAAPTSNGTVEKMKAESGL